MHGFGSVESRTPLWSDISHIINSYARLPCIILGDFNVILSEDEKRGGSPYHPSESFDFQNFISDCSLMDLGYSGTPFTWCNNRSLQERIWKRLNRALVNSYWLGSGIVSSVLHLARVGSDHSSLLITHKIQGTSKPAFRFLNFWTSHSEFLKEVCKIWDEPVSAPPISKLMIKLRKLKTHLRKWSWSTYGNLFRSFQLAEDEIKNLESHLEENPSEVNITHLNEAKAKHSQVLIREAEFWKQKSHLRWFKDGDCNSKFFQKSVQVNRATIRINCIKNLAGNWVEDPVEIADIGIEHFKNQLSDSIIYDEHYWNLLNSELHRCIPSLISEGENLTLECFPDPEEIRKAVFSFDPNSAAGPEGFNGQFFQSSWNIISEDVIAAVLEFFAGANLPKSCTATLICLIPKTKNPNSFSDYRPISLCNFFNKVLSKILASRLEAYLPNLISQNQCGFVKGRQISDNILLAE